MSAMIATWLPEPPTAEVRSALQRLAALEDVAHIAVMPDAHLAHGVCIGTVTGTRTTLLPEAVGGDIGCGMTAIAFDADAACLTTDRDASLLLAGLYADVPFVKHANRSAASLPIDLVESPLSSLMLQKLATRDGRVQLGTLGRGNHFLELQRDEANHLWLMVHSGSRGMGPLIREHHLALATKSQGLGVVDAESDEGRCYLDDVAWARRYAAHNRARMVEGVVALMARLFGATPRPDSQIDCDHNHVQSESHLGRSLWVHRKGALHAAVDVPGVIPGSMGSASYHVLGRGEPTALCSSSHGAGRSMTRTDARRRVTPKQLSEQMHGVWFDHRITDHLREEAPSAYKNISTVMRAQRDLTKITRKLRPVLVYKGG